MPDHLLGVLPEGVAFAASLVPAAALVFHRNDRAWRSHPNFRTCVWMALAGIAGWGLNFLGAVERHSGLGHGAFYPVIVLAATACVLAWAALLWRLSRTRRA